MTINFSDPFVIFQLFVNIVIVSCLCALFVSIFVNFKNAKKTEQVKREKKSIVETGSMTGFFILFYLILRFRIGVLEYDNLPIRIIISIIGLGVIVFGTYVNIIGRVNLGANWSNQIRIYKDQTMIKTGPFKYLRHPLYASLIWMFFASSIIYFNWLAFLANSLIFLPFMYMRAKQEEIELTKQFGEEYISYQKKVGMFFPKFSSK